MLKKICFALFFFMVGLSSSYIIYDGALAQAEANLKKVKSEHVSQMFAFALSSISLATYADDQVLRHNLFLTGKTVGDAAKDLREQFCSTGQLPEEDCKAIVPEKKILEVPLDFKNRDPST